MAKRKNHTLAQLLPIISVVVGILSIVMMFLPAISVKETKTTYTGWQTAFGYTEESLFGEAIIFNFSLLLFIGFIVLVAGVVISIFNIVTPKSNGFMWLAVGCFVLAMVCWFLQIQFLSVGDGFTLSGLLNPDIAKEYMQLGVGAVLGGITSAISAVVLAVSILMKKQ
jgi:hypothetical protein